MFKSARWRSDKNKFKVDFKLQFRAAQVPFSGDEPLVVSIVPSDIGKPTSKSDKAKVREGSCFWEKPLYETVKFSREPKSGKVQEKIYHFVVGNGSSSKLGVVGEASIDFSAYAESTEVTLVSLPLKSSKVHAVLHVSIQRIHEAGDQREIDDFEKVTLNFKDHSSRSQLSNNDIEETLKLESANDVYLKETVSDMTELIIKRGGSSASDITLSSSESTASGNEINFEKNGSISSHGPKSDTQKTIYEGHKISSDWGWLQDSSLEPSTDDSTMGTPLKQSLEESSDIAIGKLKSELAVLSRQAEMSEIELQTLRKQIVKESKRGQDLFTEVVCLKEERDALKLECEKLRSVSKRREDVDVRSSIEASDCWAIVEELREELNHEKEISANLRIQLHKTQESNSELILAVKDLDEMLRKKGNENLSHTSDDDDELIERGRMGQIKDDEEQKALEELVKEHGETKETSVLEQQILDLRSEIEMYKRDRDELEMQNEQLALDYEIMKQENHSMAYRLEQNQIQEQLKMQYECSSSYASARELEMQIEKLEKEVRERSNECDQSSVRISELKIQVNGLENDLRLRSKEAVEASLRASELEAHVKKLEEELEKQSLGFEANLESLTRSKIEQEQRAIKAEELLRQTRRTNANTAEKLQGELKRLSIQMVSTFEANEQVAAKALSESNELRVQRNQLEETIRRSSKDKELIKGRYEARLNHLSGKVRSMTNQIERLQLEIKNREDELKKQRKYSEENEGLLSNEITSLKHEIELYALKNEDGNEFEQMRASIREMELALKQGNDERIELERRVVLAMNESEESKKELSEIKSIMDGKEATVGNLQRELDALRTYYAELKQSMLDEEAVKEKLRKQLHMLKSDLKKKEDTITGLERKVKDRRDVDIKSGSNNSKIHARGSKDSTNLKGRIKQLEDLIKAKEAALERSTATFVEKEKELVSKNEELEERVALLDYSASSRENDIEKVGTEEARDHHDNTCDTVTNTGDNMHNIEELRRETTLLKECNASMEDELKELQMRYSEISLRFAEVEGERQQLVMKLRNLKNAK